MRVVAITGGAQGIGRATAYHFAAAGYAVSICDPDDDAGRETLGRIRSLGAKGAFAAADVARDDDVRDWIARTEHELGCPDVLSKGGIIALTHGMAISLGPHGIRVNAISPGWIETRDWQFSPRAKAPVHSERDRLQHPVGRVGRSEDIAQACLFLAE